MVISGANSSSGGTTNNTKSFSPEGISTCISEITECAKELYNCNTNINDCFASINNTLNIMGKGNSETTNFDNEISKIKYISRWLQTALDNYNKLMGNYTNETTDYTKNIGSNLTALSSNATTSRTTKKASSYSDISSGYSSNSSSYSGNESSSSVKSSTANTVAASNYYSSKGVPSVKPDDELADGWTDINHGTYYYDETTGTYAQWYENGTGGGYIVNSGISLTGEDVGHETDLGRESIAKLAVRVAATVDNPYRVGSSNVWDASMAPDGEAAQEYIKIVDAYTKQYHNVDGDNSNPAYASCTQAVGHIVRATVDPNINTDSTESMRNYLDHNSDLWEYVGTVGPGQNSTSILQPGDILTTENNQHTTLWVGNDLVRQKYPDSSANVFEADVGTGQWPNLTYQDEYLSNYPDGYAFRVYRWKGELAHEVTDENHGYTYNYPYQNVYKLLASS